MHFLNAHITIFYAKMNMSPVFIWFTINTRLIECWIDERTLRFFVQVAEQVETKKEESFNFSMTENENMKWNFWKKMNENQIWKNEWKWKND